MLNPLPEQIDDLTVISVRGDDPATAVATCICKCEKIVTRGVAVLRVGITRGRHASCKRCGFKRARSNAARSPAFVAARYVGLKEAAMAREDER